MNSPDTVAIEFGSASNNDAEHSKPPLTSENDTASSPPFKRKTVSKATLVNKLNFLNFSDRPLTVNLTHSRYGTPLSLLAQPLPCSGEQLDCIWLLPPQETTIRNHQFRDITISDGHKCLVVKPDLALINADGISLKLPESAHIHTARKAHRYDSIIIRAQLTQNGAMYQGSLTDISPNSFRIHTSPHHTSQMQWLNLELPANLQLYDQKHLLYTGECRFIRNRCEETASELVLEPVTKCFQRFKPKKFRSTRLKLVPSPSIVFSHPLINRTVNLKVNDISGSGLSVEEHAASSLLFPGLIIPRMEVQFSQKFSISCQAQVVYRSDSTNSDRGDVKCGLTILDMDMQDHVSLLTLLQQAENSCSYIDASVDMDQLWKFFFETGFMYPSKYVSLQASKDTIKSTYNKLYGHCPSIARHFIHKCKGEILGHMSMVRFYNNAWLIHHHAARKLESATAGLDVLRQISSYVNDLHNLKSSHLKYVFCYFRPDNKFPKRIFGGFAKYINNKKMCSLDYFAYFKFTYSSTTSNLSANHQLITARDEDYIELRRFYEFVSGGIMLEAFDLNFQGKHEELARVYINQGLTKNKFVFSLLADSELKAIFIADVTEAGFNLANLTNCVTVFVMDDQTPVEFIYSALSSINHHYSNQDINVMIYPSNYAANNSIPVDKSYVLWTMDLQCLDDYFMYCSKFFSYSKARGQGI